MGKIKIHEIAKEVGLTSKEIIKIANDLGIGVTSHLSAVDDEQASQIKSKVGGEKKSENKEENKTAKKDNNVAKNNKKDTTSSNSKKQETPVIIRREVIISEEEKEEQNKAKQSEDNQKQVGFVERNNKKDFNIVYRNKQTKPLTVSELFGLKPKEEK